MCLCHRCGLMSQDMNAVPVMPSHSSVALSRLTHVVEARMHSSNDSLLTFSISIPTLLNLNLLTRIPLIILALSISGSRYTLGARTLRSRSRRSENPLLPITPRRRSALDLSSGLLASALARSTSFRRLWLWGALFASAVVFGRGAELGDAVGDGLWGAVWYDVSAC